MNKHIFLMGMAAAMLMTSCTNEDDLAGGSNNQRLNSDVPIVLSAGQQANKTRASLGNVDAATGTYDGTFDTPADKNLGFFCLATGKIAAKQDITWKTGFDNPNFLWLENIPAKAVTTNDDDLGKRVTDLKLYDNPAGTTETKYYYPMGSQYSYTFYGYYPYSANVVHNGNKYSVKVTGLDGTTDLIWGKSFVNPDDPDKADAYSAKYLRDKKKRVEEAGTWDEKAHKESRPKLTFVHKLMKFNIILRKGSGGSTRIEKLGIKSAKLLNVADAGTLTIADLDNRLDALKDDVKGKEGEFVVDWTTAKNHNTETTAFQLKDKDGKVIGGETDGPYLGTNTDVTVGDGFLLPVPTRTGTNTDGSTKYEDNGYLGTDAAAFANKGIFRLRVEYYLSDAPDKVYKAAQYEITPTFKKVSGEAVNEPWQAGYEYDIVISVSDPEQIQTYGELTPWEKRVIELE